MSCPKTEHLLKEYFADDLSAVAKSEMQKHLGECSHCNEELESLLMVETDLKGWQDYRAPHWDRGIELFRREHRAAETRSPLSSLWQWMPTASSFAMLALLLFNTSIAIGDGGLEIAFGGTDGEMQAQLDFFKQSQQEEFAAFVTRVENRQDLNNLQLMQAVFDQTQQTTAENLERIYAFFEEQRLQDLEDMRVGYQQLVNNDYETIRSLEQLAQFVSFEDSVR